VNKIIRAWQFLSRHIGTGYGVAATLAAFVAPAGIYLQLHHYLPDDLAALLPVLVLVGCIVFFLAFAALSLIIRRRRGLHDQIYLPQAEIIEYKVYPYEAGSDLRRLSAFASQVFRGDTMDADIVQHAVAKGAAVGLRVTDADDNTMGFVDVFHLDPAMLEKWKRGQVRETDLKDDDFLTIPRTADPGARLELMFGAIYLKPHYELGLPFQLVDIGEAYLKQKCAHFDEIALYATIFSENGGRLARACRFKPNIEGVERQPYGGGHDLWIRRLRPNEPFRALRGVGGSREVVVTLEDS
jgi:hypothetical protein